MKLLINYANYLFRNSQRVNSASAIETAGFDRVVSYSTRDLDRVFRARNFRILRRPEGNGCWLWKPYIIDKSMDLIEEGDCLFYCDSGSYFLDSVQPLFDILQREGQDIIPFELELREREYTKRDAFVALDCDTTEYTDTNQRLAGFILFRKSCFSENFVREWLALAEDERILTDQENVLGYPNYPEFKAHRNDQSIFSLLTKRHRLEAYRNPSQFGNPFRECYPNSNYGQLINATGAVNVPLMAKIRLRTTRLVRRFRDDLSHLGRNTK